MVAERQGSQLTSPIGHWDGVRLRHDGRPPPQYADMPKNLARYEQFLRILALLDILATARGPLDDQALVAALKERLGLSRLSPRTLLVAPGDREDIVLAAVTEAAPAGLLSGLILSDGLRPHAALLSLLEKTEIPVVFSPIDSYSIAKRIHSLTVKIQPGDHEKIERIQNLVARHLDVDRLLEKIAAT